jgi:hypothetical protein
MSNSRRGGSCFHAGSGMGSGLSPSLISNARFFLLALLALAGLTPPAHAAMERLAVSNNGRHLVTQSGTPFFWMGDTNWRLYKLNEQEVNDYLNDRSSKRFNVIQGPVLLHAEDTDNHVEYVNAYGEPNTDPLNPNEAYFQHVDYIVDAAEARNMYVALVCVWGSDIEVFGSSVNEQRVNAREYGEWLGERYRNRTNVIWIVAGEYNFYGNGPDIRAVWNALGNGLKTGSDGNALITIHASYQPNHQSSSILFHNSGWLDFNMIQSSQSGNTGSGAANWQLISVDWQLSPVKPTLDGEAHYEGLGGWNAFGVRRRAYWSVFAGGFGHTYGSINVALSYRGGDDTNYYGNPELWWEAMDDPGASDMRHLRRLIESRPMLHRIPAQAMLVTPAGGVPTRMIATRDQSGRYAMVYIPKKNKTFTVNVLALSGNTVKAWWYDCRTGQASNAGQFPKAAAGGFRTFTTPNEGQDWVLVLDNVSQGYPKPGVGGPLP